MAPAAAFDLKLWPLADASSDERGTRLSLLGPLVEWNRDDGGHTRFALRPLLAAEHRPERGQWRGSFLYPLAWWENDDKGFFLRLLGLVTYERKPEAKNAESEVGSRRAFSIFPFLFYREHEDGETSFALLPLYARLKEFAGYSRIRMLLFPLFLEIEEPLVARSWFPFPFLSVVHGPAGDGFRLWPIYGHTRLGAARETTFIGWPFYVYDVERPARDDRVTTLIRWPFFSIVEGPDIDSRIYGFLIIFPIYTHTIDRKNDLETWGFPWPVWLEQRKLSTGERLTIRYAPVYQDRRTAVQRSVFYMWPFYRHRLGLGDDPTFERTDVMFLLYRDQHEGEGATRLHTRVYFPLSVSRTTRDRERSQSITFLDGLFPKNEKLEELWAPLYRIYGYERDDSGTRRDLLWRAIEWGDGGLRLPWSLSRRP